MDPIIKKQRIASLILKEKIDELSKSEKEELTLGFKLLPKTRKYTPAYKKKVSARILPDTNK